MELPAHLPECLLLSELSASLVSMNQLHPIILLIACIAKGTKDLLGSLVFVSPKELILAQHASLPEDQQSVAYALSAKSLLQRLNDCIFDLFLGL